MKKLVFGFAFLLSLPASAQPKDRGVEDERSDEKHGPGVSDFHFNGGFGWSRDTTLGDSVVHSMTAGYRWRFVDVGVTADLGNPIEQGGYAAITAAIGPTLQLDNGLRFGLLASAGVDHYYRMGCGIYCSTGASGTLPYTGARVSAAYVLPAGGNAHLELGVAGFAGTDLGKQTVASDAGEQKLGGSRVGAVFTVGMTFDTQPNAKKKTTAKRSNRNAKRTTQ
jgi:hypothetical protein